MGFYNGIFPGRAENKKNLRWLLWLQAIESQKAETSVFVDELRKQLHHSRLSILRLNLSRPEALPGLDQGTEQVSCGSTTKIPQLGHLQACYNFCLTAHGTVLGP